ncbi:MAG: hypothetical protein RIG62_08575 [Cyclobacteriaceae bacterium]
MKAARTFLVIYLVATFWVSAFAGGGWTQSKRSGYFKLGQNFIIANRYYQPNGEIAEITTISFFTTSAYLEYGFSDRLTGVLYFPFFVRSTLNQVEYTSGRTPIPGDAVNSLGDTNIGLKYGILPDGPVVVAVGLTLGVPLGATAGGETRILQTGDGEFNQLITLEASRSFGSAYATALLGFNNRTQDFSDEFRYGLEIGYTWNGKLLTQLRLSGVESLMNGEAEGGGGNSIFANNTEYLAITPEIAYNIRDNMGVSVNAGFAAFGRKILASPNFGMGLFYTF